MSRRYDPVRVRNARIEGAARGIQDAIFLADTAVLERHRAELPKLWAAVDRLRDALNTKTGNRGFNRLVGD
jgi:hypothetical protein